MAESKIHNWCVDVIVKWLVINLMIDSKRIYTDTFTSTTKPGYIGDHIPDVLVLKNDKYDVIIGEAKATIEDLESRHTKLQITDYIKYCSLYDKSLFILMTPYYLTNCARSIINNILNKCNISNVQVIILNLDDLIKIGQTHASY